MLTETITVGDLVTRTLDVLHRHTERPETRAVTAGSPVLMANTLGVTSGTLLEAGYELMRVTAVVANTSATVEHQYLGTPAASGYTTVAKDPLWPRQQALRAVSDVLSGLHGQVPLIKSAESTVLADKYYVDLTALTDLWRPLRVGAFSYGHWADLAGWEFVADVTTTDEPGVTQFLTLPPGLLPGDKVVLTYRAKYTAVSYTTPNDATSVTVPLGARDLPALGAAARLLSNREVSRAEIDRVEEGANEAAIRGGWTLNAVSALWKEYYRRVDEVARTATVTEPRHRPYRKMQGTKWRRGL